MDIGEETKRITIEPLPTTTPRKEEVPSPREAPEVEPAPQPQREPEPEPVPAYHGKLKDGTPIDDEMVETLADEAEAGYDLDSRGPA